MKLPHWMSSRCHLLFPILVAACLATLVTHTYFRVGFAITHDGENHLARFANYVQAIRERQYPPRFAPNLMNRYGYPVFNYNYPLANVLSLPLSLLDVPYPLIFKVIVLSSVLVGLSGMWWWVRWLGWSTAAAYTAMVLFAVSPYLWNTILYRGNIGEVLALGLIPWLLVTVEVIYRYRNLPYRWWLIAFTTWMLFLLAHNVTVVFAIPIIFSYAWWRFRLDRSKWLTLVKLLALAVLSTLWFWLPAVMEKNEVVLDRASLSLDFVNHFPTLTQLLFSPGFFGFSYPGSIDSLSFSIGLVYGLVMVVTSLLYLKNWRNWSIKPTAQIVKWLLIVSWLLLVFQLAVTEPVWRLIPLVRFIQFPWRLSLFLAVTVPLMGAWLWESLTSNWKRLLVILVLVQFIYLLRLQPVGYTNRPAIEYDSFSQSTTTLNENLPQNFKYLQIGDWQPTPVILTGKGSIGVELWQGTRRRYSLDITEDSVIVEPTMNFLGWQTEVKSVENGQPISNIAYTDSDQIQGRLAYQLPIGKYHVYSHFTQHTPARLIGNLVSLVTIGAVALWSVNYGWQVFATHKGKRD